MLLSDAFDETIRLLATEDPDSSDHVGRLFRASLSVDEQLALYAQYQKATRSDAVAIPSRWNIRQYRKYQACQDCTMTREQAMMAYVTFVGQRLDELSASTEAGDDTAVRRMRDQCRALCNSVTSSRNESAVHDELVQPLSTPVDPSSREDARVAPPARPWSEPFTYILTVLLGIVPLIPRGQLDITLSDLWFAVCQCVALTLCGRDAHARYVALDAHIAAQWRHALSRTRIVPSKVETETPAVVVAAAVASSGLNPPPDVMVGLSVRSLLDLYLRIQQYPPGSHVIVSPPMNVPGLLQVLAHHQLVVVGVDLVDDVTVGLNVDAIVHAVTPQTVAILVVHVFGMVAATEADFADLSARLAATRASSWPPIAIWEDCAESFTGLDASSYLGSPYADVVFFSFGTIKTMTALGGGIALVRPTSVNRGTRRDASQRVFEAMCRLHSSSAYEQSTHWQFVITVIKCTLLRTITQSPLWYGLAFHLCRGCGWNWDALVTGLVRTFRLDRTDSMRGTSKASTNGMIGAIRKRPSTALMALLHRRFSQSTTRASVERRVQNGSELTQLLQRQCDHVRIPVPRLGARNFYWLFPILVDDPTGESSRLQQRGFDVTRGASQLVCVDDACPRASRLMKQLVYLPIVRIAHHSLGDTYAPQMVRAILDQPNSKENSSNQSTQGRFRPNCWLWLLMAIVLFPRWLLLSVAALVVRVVMLSCVAAGATVWVLRVCMGKFYVESSKGLAKHCDLLDHQVRRAKEANASSSTLNILSSLKALELHPPLDQEERRRTVFLSGGTGFLGSLILRDLLMYRALLRIDHVIVLCRAKKGKSGKERMSSALSAPMYAFLSLDERDSLVEVIDGDASTVNAGMCDSEIDRLRTNYTITHVINCAASVSFTQSLGDAATANVSSSLNLQNLGTLLSSTSVQFVQISTAFVHGGQSGERQNPLLGVLNPLGKYCPFEIYKSMCSSQYYASKAMHELGFANTYTFSKCIGEHLLLRNDPTTIIIRPSIVGPAIESPYEGWAGRLPSTLVAAASLYLSYQWNLWSFGCERVPCIPVDVVSRYVLAKAFNGNPSIGGEVVSDETSSDESYEKLVRPASPSTESTCSVDSNLPRPHLIFTAAWDTSSLDGSCFTWFDYAGAVTQVGTMLHYFNRSTAYVGLFLATRVIPSMRLSSNQFETLHRWVVRAPFALAHQICDVLGHNSVAMQRLKTYLDLPMLFFPFMNREFHFRSDLTAPPQLSGERYLVSCVSAAHFFIAQAGSSHGSKPRQIGEMTAYSMDGVNRKTLMSSIYWVLAQPHGNALIRVVAFILRPVLGRCFSDITVDIASFSCAHRAKESLGSACLVLAPTHRSYFDFLLLSYMSFSLPELQIGIPYIAAADSFGCIPILGRMIGFLGAFFVRRGRCTVDPDLSSTVKSIKRRQHDPTIEVFIEGTRSRDRRFVSPKTGVLRCLREAGGQYVIIPITISYERIAEQEDLVRESVSGVTSKMHVGPMLCWLADALLGKIRLGRVHISACEPLIITDTVEPDWKSVTCEIQRRQVEAIVLSDYHVDAASQLLSLDSQVVLSAFSKLGVKLLCTTSPEAKLRVPRDSSELLSLLLQASPYLSALFQSERPSWAEWLHPASLRPNQEDIDEDLSEDAHVKLLSQSLLSLFDAADGCVDAGISQLKSKGFADPEHRHILQICQQQTSGVPSLLLHTSIRRQHTCSKPPARTSNRFEAHRMIGRSTNSAETLGWWGFSDSCFIIRVDTDGTPFVSLSGDRYSLRGKKIKRLIPFIEAETTVKLNPLFEAFSRETKVRGCTACQLTDKDVALLKAAITVVSILDDDRIRHGTGHSQEDVFSIRSGAVLRVPDAVVWPSSEEEITKVVELAMALQWCVVPFGGGTNVSQATRCPPLDVEPRPIISLDMRKMSRVIWIDEENGLANVEAGITGSQLEEDMSRRGYTIGHEPDSKEFSTLGGWIATKASGMKRNKYGNIEDIVKAVRVLGPNGILRHGCESGSHIWGRESSGMDLCNFALGSEGCLGIITSAVIRIWPLPEVKQFDSILLRDFGEGLRFVRKIAKLGQNVPVSVRLLDNEHFRLGLALQPESSASLFTLPRMALGSMLSYRAGFQRHSVVCVTIAYEGTRDEVEAQESTLRRLVAQHGGVRLGPAVGKSGYELTFMIAYLRDFAMTFHYLSESFETFAPWSQVETIISKTKERIRREHAARCLPGRPFVGSRVTQLYHEGACIYFYFCMSFDGVDNASSVYAEIEHAARSEVLTHGGSLSHHHGIGKIRSSFLNDVNSVPWQDTMKSIKEGFDPSNVFGARNGAFATGSGRSGETYNRL